jgi:hypothetical protein
MRHEGREFRKAQWLGLLIVLIPAGALLAYSIANMASGQLERSSANNELGIEGAAYLGVAFAVATIASALRLRHLSRAGLNEQRASQSLGHLAISPMWAARRGALRRIALGLGVISAGLLVIGLTTFPNHSVGALAASRVELASTEVWIAGLLGGVAVVASSINRMP